MISTGAVVSILLTIFLLTVVGAAEVSMPHTLIKNVDCSTASSGSVIILFPSVHAGPLLGSNATLFWYLYNCTAPVTIFVEKNSTAAAGIRFLQLIIAAPLAGLSISSTSVDVLQVMFLGNSTFALQPTQRTLIEVVARVENASYIFVGSIATMHRYVEILSHGLSTSLPSAQASNDPGEARFVTRIPLNCTLIALFSPPSFLQLLFAEDVLVLVDGARLLHVQPSVCATNATVPGGLRVELRGAVHVSATDEQAAMLPPGFVASVLSMGSMDTLQFLHEPSTNKTLWWVVGSGYVSPTVTDPAIFTLPRVDIIASSGAVIAVVGASTWRSAAFVFVLSVLSWAGGSTLHVQAGATVSLRGSSAAFIVITPVPNGLFMQVGALPTDTPTTTMPTSTVVNSTDGAALLYMTPAAVSLVNQTLLLALLDVNYPLLRLDDIHFLAESASFSLAGSGSSLIALRGVASSDSAFPPVPEQLASSLRVMLGFFAITFLGSTIHVIDDAVMMILHSVDLRGDIAGPPAFSLETYCPHTSTQADAFGVVRLCLGSFMDVANASVGGLAQLKDVAIGNISAANHTPVSEHALLVTIASSSSIHLYGVDSTLVYMTGTAASNTTGAPVEHANRTLLYIPVVIQIDGHSSVQTRNLSADAFLFSNNRPSLVTLATAASIAFVTHTAGCRLIIRNNSLMNETSLLRAPTGAVVKTVVVYVERSSFLVVGPHNDVLLALLDNSSLSDVAIHVLSSSTVWLRGTGRLIGTSFANSTPTIYRDVHLHVADQSTVQQELAGFISVARCSDVSAVSVSFVNGSSLLQLQTPESRVKESATLLFFAATTPAQVRNISILFEDSHIVPIDAFHAVGRSPQVCSQLLSTFNVSVVQQMLVVFRSRWNLTNTSSTLLCRGSGVRSGRAVLQLTGNGSAIDVTVVLDGVHLQLEDSGYLMFASELVNLSFQFGHPAAYSPTLISTIQSSSLADHSSIVLAVVATGVNITFFHGSLLALGNASAVLMARRVAQLVCTIHPPADASMAAPRVIMSGGYCSMISAVEWMRRVAMHVYAVVMIQGSACLLESFESMHDIELCVASSTNGSASMYVVDYSYLVRVLRAGNASQITVIMTALDELVIANMSGMIKTGLSLSPGKPSLSVVSCELRSIRSILVSTSSLFHVENQEASSPLLRGMDNITIRVSNSPSMRVRHGVFAMGRTISNVAVEISDHSVILLSDVSFVLDASLSGSSAVNVTVTVSAVSSVTLVGESAFISCEHALSSGDLVVTGMGTKVISSENSRLFSAQTAAEDLSIGIYDAATLLSTASGIMCGGSARGITVTIVGSGTLVNVSSTYGFLVFAYRAVSQLHINILDGARFVASGTEAGSFLFADESINVVIVVARRGSVSLANDAVGLLVRSLRGMALHFESGPVGNPYVLQLLSQSLFFLTTQALDVSARFVGDGSTLVSSSYFIRVRLSLTNATFTITDGASIVANSASIWIYAVADLGVAGPTNVSGIAITCGARTRFVLDGSVFIRGSSQTVNPLRLRDVVWRIEQRGVCRLQSRAYAILGAATLDNLKVVIRNGSLLQLSFSSCVVYGPLNSVSTVDAVVSDGGSVVTFDGESCFISAMYESAVNVTNVSLTICEAAQVSIHDNSHWIKMVFGAMGSLWKLTLRDNANMTIRASSSWATAQFLNILSLVNVSILYNSTMNLIGASQGRCHVVDMYAIANASLFSVSISADDDDDSNPSIVNAATPPTLFVDRVSILLSFECSIFRPGNAVSFVSIVVSNAIVAALTDSVSSIFVACFSCKLPAVSHLSVQLRNTVMEMRGSSRLYPGYYLVDSVLSSWNVHVHRLSVRRIDVLRSSASTTADGTEEATLSAVFFVVVSGTGGLCSNGTMTLQDSIIIANAAAADFATLVPQLSTQLGPIIRQQFGNLHIRLLTMLGNPLIHLSVEVRNVTYIAGDSTMLIAITNPGAWISGFVFRVENCFIALNVSAHWVSVERGARIDGVFQHASINSTWSVNGHWETVNRTTGGPLFTITSNVIHVGSNATLDTESGASLTMHWLRCSITLGVRAALLNISLSTAVVASPRACISSNATSPHVDVVFVNTTVDIDPSTAPMYGQAPHWRSQSPSASSRDLAAPQHNSALILITIRERPVNTSVSCAGFNQTIAGRPSVVFTCLGSNITTSPRYLPQNISADRHHPIRTMSTIVHMEGEHDRFDGAPPPNWTGDAMLRVRVVLGASTRIMMTPSQRPNAQGSDVAEFNPYPLISVHGPHVVINTSGTSLVVQDAMAVDGFSAVLGAVAFDTDSTDSAVDVVWWRCIVSRVIQENGAVIGRRLETNAQWTVGGSRRSFGSKCSVILLADASNGTATLLPPRVQFQVLLAAGMHCLPNALMSSTPTFSIAQSSTARVSSSTSLDHTRSEREVSLSLTVAQTENSQSASRSGSASPSGIPPLSALERYLSATEYRVIVRAVVAVGLFSATGGFSGVNAAFVSRVGSSLLDCGCDLTADLDILQNPLQLRIGALEGSSIRGAVVGNVVMLIAIASVMIGVSGAVACFSRRPQRMMSDVDKRAEVFSRVLRKGFSFPGVLLAPFAILIVPVGSGTAATLIYLDPAHETHTNIAFAIFGCMLLFSGVAMISYVILFRFGAMFIRRSTSPFEQFRSKNVVLRLLRKHVVSRKSIGAWQKNTALKKSSLPHFVSRFGYLFDGFRERRHWFGLFELFSAAAICVIEGLEPPEDPTADCTTLLRALSGWCALHFVLLAVLRPATVPFEHVFALMTVGCGVLAAAVGAANVNGAGELFDLQMWIGLLELVFVASAALSSGDLVDEAKRWWSVFSLSTDAVENILSVARQPVQPQLVISPYSVQPRHAPLCFPVPKPKHHLRSYRLSQRGTEVSSKKSAAMRSIFRFIFRWESANSRQRISDDDMPSLEVLIIAACARQKIISPKRTDL